MEKSQENPAYFLTIFKLKGKQMWRAHLSAFADGFHREVEMLTKEKIQEIRVVKVDRTEGFIIPM